MMEQNRDISIQPCCYTEEQTAAYLERLGIPDRGALSPSAETLSRIVRSHVETVPYETMDMVLGVPVSVSPQAAFDKLVLRKRGGYCFELNGALAALLRGLGFSVRECFGRVLLGERELPKPRHRIVLVQTADGRYVCDAGMCVEGPRMALKLEPELEQWDGMCRYKFTQNEDLGWILWQDPFEQGFRAFYSFFDTPCYDSDFTAISWYCGNHPDSVFLRPMVSLKTPEGLILLKNGRLTRSHRGRIEKEEEICTRSALTRALRDDFGIIL